MTEPGDYPTAERALHELRQALATMRFDDPRGECTALDMCGRLVDSIAEVVALSKRAAIFAEQAKTPRVVVRPGDEPLTPEQEAAAIDVMAEFLESNGVDLSTLPSIEDGRIVYPDS